MLYLEGKRQQQISSKNILGEKSTYSYGTEGVANKHNFKHLDFVDFHLLLLQVDLICGAIHVRLPTILLEF